MLAIQQLRIRLGALVALFIVGCVTAPQPLTELDLARSAIEQAQQLGAAQTAPTELAAARDHLSEAERLAPRDADMAKWRAHEAEADANLAAATARDARAHAAISQLN